MSNIVPITGIQAPALANAFGYQESDLTDGAALGFPVMSYRGKVWRLVHKGNETKLMTPDGDPMPSIRVIILKANAHLSKIYYAKNYSEGDDAAPDCFSMNGEKPDASVKNPQCGTCDMCPQNAWGSKVSEEGKELKACADSRRIVIVPANDIANEAMGGPMLLRVPAASLGNLVAYDDRLKKANVAYFGVATKISFDSDVAYPKLVFDFDADMTARLTAEDGQKILDIRESDSVNRILSTQSHQENIATDAEPAAPARPAKQPARPPQQQVEEVQTPAPTPPPEPVTQAAPESPEPAASEVVEPEHVEQAPASGSSVDALVDGLLGS